MNTDAARHFPVAEPGTVEVPDELRDSIESAMAQYPQRRSAVIPALHAAQDHYGWCSPEAMEVVAAVMQVTPAFVESIASFYDLFRTEPAGRHKVMVCTNLSCMMRGSAKVVEAFESELGLEPGGCSDDGEFQLETFECLGACDIAPMASLDGHYRGPIDPDEVPQVVDDLRNGREPLPEKKFVGDFGRRQ